ncbi:MAG: protein phosphatase 2C domain-containing protein [Acidobacteriota bacterium]
MTTSVASQTGTWVSVSVCTDVGMRRAGNEDNLQVVDLTGERRGLAHRESPLSPEVAQHRLGELGTLLIVSDGMGGAAAGEVASEMAVDIVACEMLHQVSTGTPSREAMRKAADSANAAIWERSQNESAIRGLGATLTAVHLCGQEATISQVGDSRAYLVRDGTIRQLTEDQSWANAAKKAGMQVANVPNNIILQALGTQRVVNTEITTEVIQPNDIFLLCSDGLSNKVEDHELLSCVVTASSLDAAAKSLIKLANDRGGEDNITVIIARLFTIDDPDAISDSHATQLLASEPSGENVVPVSSVRTTSDLLGSQPTLSNFTVKTQNNLATTTDTVAKASTSADRLPALPAVTASAVETPVEPTAPSSRRLSKSGKLFVFLALAAVGVIVLAGVAAMIWVLQLRNEKERSSAPQPSPALAPIGLPPSAPETPAPALPPAESGSASGIGRIDDLSLGDVEKKLEQIERQTKHVERQLGQIPGYDAERQDCKKHCERLAVLKDALNRHRQQRAQQGDPDLSDIEKEVQSISQWLDRLPAPLRQMEAPRNKPPGISPKPSLGR